MDNENKLDSETLEKIDKETHLVGSGWLPTQKGEIVEDNHLKAGMVYGGKDRDGEDEWIGTTAEWREYERLEREDENDFSGATYLEGTENSGQER